MLLSNELFHFGIIDGLEDLRGRGNDAGHAHHHEAPKPQVHVAGVSASISEHNKSSGSGVVGQRFGSEFQS